MHSCSTTIKITIGNNQINKSLKYPRNSACSKNGKRRLLLLCTWAQTCRMWSTPLQLKVTPYKAEVHTVRGHLGAVGQIKAAVNTPELNL